MAWNKIRVNIMGNSGRNNIGKTESIIGSRLEVLQRHKHSSMDIHGVMKLHGPTCNYLV